MGIAMLHSPKFIMTSDHLFISHMQVTQRLGKVEKTTKDPRQASLQLAALLKEIEKTVKATQAMQVSNAAFQNDLWVTSD